MHSNLDNPEKWSIHPTKTVDVNGLEYSYLEAGGGKTIVLLHGFPDLAFTWDETIKRLTQKNYHCIAPYLRGYYPTDLAKDGDYTAKTIAQDILTLCDKVNGDDSNDLYVIGHDWGASIAYALANLAPERVKKLVTVAIPHPSFIKVSLSLAYKARHFIAFRNRKRSVNLCRKNNFAYIDKLYKRWSPNWKDYESQGKIVKQTFEKPGRLEAALNYYWSFNDKLDDKALQSFYLQLPQMPTLTFAGKTDGALVMKQFYAMKKGMPDDFRLRISETAGHFLHQEAPDFFVDELLDFFR